MAVRKTSSTGAKTPAVKQTREQLEMQERISETFKAISEELKLINLAKNQTRTFQTFSKETLRQYLRNPLSNENNLRNLSKYLYRYSFAYRQIIWYAATMYDLNAYSVVPIYDMTKNFNEKKVKKSFYATASMMQKIALDQVLLPMLLTAWREDAAFGYIYMDDDDFFIHLLPGEYCKISSIENGVFRYAFDFSYFRSHEDDLYYWDGEKNSGEFHKKFRAYENDPDLRWQELDYAREVCFKVNSDDPTMCFPPYAPTFNSIIDLVDLASIQAVKDELSVYKLLIARMETLTGTKLPDDFTVDIKTALKYFEKFEKSLPDGIAAAISPLPIDVIEFDPTDSSDTDMISNSTKNLIKNTSAANILYSDGDGTTITKLKAICDENMILSALLPQIQAWVNLQLNYWVGVDHAHVKYFKIGPYTREDRKSEFLTDAQYSVPAKLAVSSLDGFTPLEAYCIATLENEILRLSENWEPLQSTHTQAGNVIGDVDSKSDTGGAPTKDTGDLTDAGEKTRENK